MAIPVTRTQFKEHCLRRLGWPAIAIEVTEEQLDDRVDEALYFYKDYHFDASQTVYYKHKVEERNRPDRIYDITISNGGTSYANGDPVVFTGGSHPGAGVRSANAVVITDGSGTITDFTFNDHGQGYATEPTLSITSGTGSGFSGTATLGGFIPVPENVMGAIRVFPVGQALGSNDIFNIRYQIALNDLYTLTSVSMVPYFSAFQHIELIQQILVGEQPIRLQRHKDRMYLDMNWNVVPNNAYLLVEATEVVDPEVFTDVWGDRWLQQYCTALIKRQWGETLSKYANGGMKLPSGLDFNGPEIFMRAQEEILRLEEEVLRSYSMPPRFFVG